MARVKSKSEIDINYLYGLKSDNLDTLFDELHRAKEEYSERRAFITVNRKTYSEEEVRDIIIIHQKINKVLNLLNGLCKSDEKKEEKNNSVSRGFYGKY